VARTRLTLSILATVFAPPAAAQAGEAACWFEGGVLVVPAQVAGIAGDYILDTGSPRTQLHETKAQAEGIEALEVTGGVRMAGRELPDVAIPVVDLDYRGWNLPTPIVGVIGADVLKDLVVDVTFAPCRIRLSTAAEAPAFRAARTLPMTWDEGRPVVEAEVADGQRALRGPFTPATGLSAAVRLADDLAAVPGTDRPQELQPQGVWLARLPQLGFAGRRIEDQAAGLAPLSGESAGAIGGPVLSRFRLRFDFPGGKLLVGPAR
jgi:hypothetical protein